MSIAPLPYPFRLGLVSMLAIGTWAHAAPAGPRLPAITPTLPEYRLNPKQPELPPLRNTATEHGPTYTPPKDQFIGLFTPFRTDRAALSPDGKYLAYTVRDGESVSIVIVAIDHPEKALTRVTVATDETSTPMLAENQEEKTPARIRWMRWTTNTRLAVETNGAFAVGNGGPWTTSTGAVFGIDADGGNARLLATPRDILETMPNEAAVAAASNPSSPTDWSPDQPLPAATTDPMATPNPAAVDSGISDDPLAATAQNTVQPFTTAAVSDIHVSDLDFDHAGSVLLQAIGARRANGERHIVCLRLDSVTGKLQRLSEDVVPGLDQGLVDRAGHVRLTLPVTLRTPFPHAYTYLGATGGSVPRRLDRVVGLPESTGFSVSPDNFFGERSIPLGFDVNPAVLYYAADIGRNTFGVYSLDLTTGLKGATAFENPTFDLIPPIESFGRRRILVFDRFTHRLAGIRFDAAVTTAAWADPVLQAVQAVVQQTLPGRSVDILDWDQAKNRFLILVTAPGDSGAFFVFDRGAGHLAQFVRRAPWIDANQAHRTITFTFPTVGELSLMGVATIPSHPRIKPMPVVVFCPDLPWVRVAPQYSERVNALADMGFVVLQLNGRGAWGLGRHYREAINAGYDTAQVEDVMAEIDFANEHFKIDPKRVALFGEGHGGFIALRTLQSHPDRFRSAVALNPPVDLQAWLDENRWTTRDAGPALTRGELGDAARLKAAPLINRPEEITKPVFVLSYPGPDGTPRSSTYLAAKDFTAKVRRHAEETEFGDLSMDYVRGLPKALSNTYQRIEDFLNVTVYDYHVKLGQPRVAPDSK